MDWVLVPLIWLRRVLVTIWFWFWAAIATIFLQIAVWVFGARSHDTITWLIENLMANIIFCSMTWTRIWDVEVYHVSNVEEDQTLDPNGPFLLAANHNSIVDTLFMALLPHRKSYTFNTKWSWVPIFGPLCVQAGYVGIDTSNPTQKAQVVPHIVTKMKDNYSMMIYPQGARSVTPENFLTKADLKHGTFSIAKEGGFKVLPICIQGTDQAMMRGGWCDVATINIIICKPFTVQEVEQGKEDFCYAINGARKAKLKAE